MLWPRLVIFCLAIVFVNTAYGFNGQQSESSSAEAVLSETEGARPAETAPSNSAPNNTMLSNTASDNTVTENGTPQVAQQTSTPVLFSNDAVLFGVLMTMLGLIFWTNSLEHVFWRRFYTLVPVILLCYFLPSLLTLFGLVDPEVSKLYSMAKNYLLPASLILFTLSIDMKEIVRLGPKALIMFFTGTAGVILGGPIAVLITTILFPDLLGSDGPDAIWRGLSTVAGSWIGGGANQAAMKETFEPSNELYSVMVAVDVLVAEFWMVFLLLGVGQSQRIDRFVKADASSVESLQQKMEAYSKSVARIPTGTDFFVLLAIAFGGTGCCHFFSDHLASWVEANSPALAQYSLDSAFFWLVILATTLGVCLSLTPMRKIEGVGASKLGSVCIFILVATIGLHMDIAAVARHPEYFLIGLIWMLFHVGLLFLVGYFIRAPYFFLAVGSKANVGGAASAPVVAAAFHPSLAPVGVLLAVLGYALGTYGAWICGNMMRIVAGGS